MSVSISIHNWRQLKGFKKKVVAFRIAVSCGISIAKQIYQKLVPMILQPGDQLNVSYTLNIKEE